MNADAKPNVGKDAGPITDADANPDLLIYTGADTESDVRTGTGADADPAVDASAEPKISMWDVVFGSVANCWRAHPPLFVAFIFISATLCAAQAGEVFAMRRFFDAAADFIDGRIPTESVLAAAAPLAALLALFPVVNVFAWLGQGYFWRRGSGYLMARYHDSVQRIPLIDFEKTGTFDRMQRAQTGSEEAPSAGRSVIQILFYFIPYALLNSAFLFSVKPILLAALVFIFGSVILAQILRAGIIRRFTEQNAGLRRQTDYLESCITGKEYLKETRTLGATRYFFRLFAESVKRYNSASMNTVRKVAFIELLLRAVNVIGYIGILAMLVF
jgi:ATP-binding cassette subfamily B protein